MIQLTGRSNEISISLCLFIARRSSSTSAISTLSHAQTDQGQGKLGTPGITIIASSLFLSNRFLIKRRDIGYGQVFISSTKNFSEILTGRKLAQELKCTCIPGPWLENFAGELSSQGALMRCYLALPAWDGSKLSIGFPFKSPWHLMPMGSGTRVRRACLPWILALLAFEIATSASQLGSMGSKGKLAGLELGLGRLSSSQVPYPGVTVPSTHLAVPEFGQEARSSRTEPLHLPQTWDWEGKKQGTLPHCSLPFSD